MAQRKPLKTKQWLGSIVALFVIVLIAHLAIITKAADQFNIQKAEKTTTFTTRRLDLPAPPPAVEKRAEPVTPQKPLPKPVKPKSAPASAPASAPVAVPNLAPAAELTTATPVPPVLVPSPVELAAAPSESTPPVSSSAAVASELPPPAFTALSSGQHNYKALFTNNGNTNQGRAEMRWQQDGEKYALSLSASLLMLEALTWKSTGAMSPQGLLPERFSDKRLRKSEVAAHFDRVQNKIIFSANTPNALLQAGAQDRISVILQLSGLLMADPARYPPGAIIPLQMVDATEAEMWVFSVNEPETLNLEGGSQIALRLTRNPRKEFDRKLELWFAPALGYLPVRLRQTQTNGDYFDFVWQNSQVLPNAAAK
jgi:hypothetical protein